MNLGLDGRAYIVTGGSSGLGLAAARALVADGAHVVLVARDADRLAVAAGDLGERAIHVAGDLAEPDLVTRTADVCRERFGRVDGGFVSYGGPEHGPAATMEDDALRTSVDRALVEPVRAVRDLVTASDQDASVLLLASTSTSTLQPIPGLVGSNLTRPGLWGFVKTLADEVGPDGTRVNLLIPGSFGTDRLDEVLRGRADADGSTVEFQRAHAAASIPLRRLGNPDELGRVAAFLLSPAASYVTGSAWRVDGGVIRGL